MRNLSISFILAGLLLIITGVYFAQLKINSSHTTETTVVLTLSEAQNLANDITELMQERDNAVSIAKEAISKYQTIENSKCT